MIFLIDRLFCDFCCKTTAVLLCCFSLFFSDLFIRSFMLSLIVMYSFMHRPICSFLHWFIYPWIHFPHLFSLLLHDWCYTLYIVYIVIYSSDFSFSFMCVFPQLFETYGLFLSHLFYNSFPNLSFEWADAGRRDRKRVKLPRAKEENSLQKPIASSKEDHNCRFLVGCPWVKKKSPTGTRSGWVDFSFYQ